MLDLYVWGSAFGLPSIDAECLAIITYLHNSLSSTDWRLIPSNDASVSPSRTSQISPPSLVSFVLSLTRRHLL